MKVLHRSDVPKQVKMDAKDIAILTQLAEHARTSITQLAKRAKLSRDATARRIKQYEEKGVITGYRTVIDAKRFDQLNIHVFLTLDGPVPSEQDTLITYLIEHERVRSVLKFSGRFDLEIAIVADSLEQFQQILNDILQQCGTQLTTHEILIITDQYRSTVFTNSFITTTPRKETRAQPYDMDDTDRKILRQLADDARTPLHRVANTIGISADTVAYRLRRLENGGVIRGYIPVVNHDMLGFTAYAVLADLRGLRPKEDVRLREFFQTDENVLWAVKTIGQYNALFYILTRDPASVHETLRNLRNLFPKKLQDFEMLMANEQYKFTLLPKALQKTDQDG